ncbi:MAG TPA: YbfB/YjiJ family MFS transporter, partial [Pseudorhodoferax sp.]|nr:YbfB/YjiJ family MFS transporter [Pseudorhodoferax sp.]
SAGAATMSTAGPPPGARYRSAQREGSPVRRAALAALLRALRPSLEAALILAVGMGVSRFAFTAVYPQMVREGLLSLPHAGLAASANYGGYLLGALAAMRARPQHALRVCLASAAGSIACLAALGLLENAAGIIAVRALAGAFSALAMVAAALWLFEHRRQLHGAPVLFGGVGLGIALSSELLVLAQAMQLHSHGLWLVLALACTLLSLAAVPGMARGGVAAPTTDAGPAQAPAAGQAQAVQATPLLAVYGMAGFGYIITATYLPLLVQQALPALAPAHVWALFGLGAIPSCFLWHRLHARLGTRGALAANLAVQALGVAMPLLSASPLGYLLSAVLVGATFMGTVTIALPAARLAGAATGRPLVARMTVVYSLGQIAGPLAASALYAQSHSFSGALAAATAVLVAAAALSRTLL